MGGLSVRKINEFIEGIRDAKGWSRAEEAEKAQKLGYSLTKDQLDKHVENDSDNSFVIAVRCRVYGIPFMPPEWFLKKKIGADR